MNHTVFPRDTRAGDEARTRDDYWEAFLGLWLTFKGFKPVAGDATETVDVRGGPGAPVHAVVAA